MTRCVWLALLVCAGCHGALGNAPEPPPQELPALSLTYPLHIPDQTSDASDTDAFDESAEQLDQGDELAAVRELEQYVTKHPDDLLLRIQLGEVLLRLHKLDQARLHFQLHIALAQDQGEKSVRYQIHSHSRLVEIAEQQEDAYEEQLNRGIGLYLLARKRDAEAAQTSELKGDSLFHRAANALHDARQVEPAQSRPDLYLYHIWSRLGQRSAAERALAAANAHAFASALTPRERRELHLAQLTIQHDRLLLPGVSRVSR